VIRSTKDSSIGFKYLEQRAQMAKKICISPKYKNSQLKCGTPKNRGSGETLDSSEADKRDLLLAKESRNDQVKAEIARIEARKKRFQKENKDVFSFLLGYFGCC
jgi:hypothetical protein